MGEARNELLELREQYAELEEENLKLKAEVARQVQETNGWKMSSVSTGHHLIEARQKTKALHAALSYTYLFREFMDEWHDPNNKEVVEFRRLREEALGKWN